MKKLTYLLFLAIGVTACSVESIDSTENLTVADAKYKMQQAENPMGFYSGNSGNLKGTLSVWNDCDNLYVQIVPEGDAPEDAELGLFTTLPAINNGGNLISDLEFDLSDAAELTWSISLNNLNTESELIVFAKAWGDWAGVLVHGKLEYSIYNFDLSGCEEVELNCNSGYMIGDKNFNEIGTSNNWGWAHKFELGDAGSETREIHHKKGSLGGSVTVSIDNGVISIVEGMGVTISHLYISDAEPTSTNAPGQFDKEQTFTDLDGTFWVMLKAEVCN